MAKSKTRFVCQTCGHSAHRWMGQCPGCQSWSSMVEEFDQSGPRKSPSSSAARPTITLSEVSANQEPRLPTGVDEFDRVLGGGIVPGSVVLVAGDPGIGKSTLMTEVAALLNGRRVLYVCGEESPSQVRLRADRLGVEGTHVDLLPETDVDAVIATAAERDPSVMIVDSVQTLYRADLTSAPGSVSQIRESSAALIRAAKGSGMAVFLVGHVTKEGTIAGPRVLEHMVDTVLHLEGDRHHAFRILRAVKNRFGSTNEIGVFEMQGKGLVPVTNPSAVFLSERGSSSGSAVVCTVEGTRPMLVEIQALVTDSSYASPQRAATGFDGRRLQMLLAVLEKRQGLRVSSQDVFVNVAGGLKLSEPAADLGILMAVASSLLDRPLPPDTAIIGEVGLGGEVRSVSQISVRIREAEKLGFRAAVVPSRGTHDSPLDLI
ncbi:MAG: DNA repair protein RadA, partial [Rhodothermales bacterium]|nr:DNA repair protein RadA [Rhodothermales bacterium]